MVSLVQAHGVGRQKSWNLISLLSWFAQDDLLLPLKPRPWFPFEPWRQNFNSCGEPGRLGCCPGHYLPGWPLLPAFPLGKQKVAWWGRHRNDRSEGRETPWFCFAVSSLQCSRLWCEILHTQRFSEQNWFLGLTPCCQRELWVLAASFLKDEKAVPLPASDLFLFGSDSVLGVQSSNKCSPQVEAGTWCSLIVSSGSVSLSSDCVPGPGDIEWQKRSSYP